MQKIISACETDDAFQLKAALLEYEPKIKGKADIKDQKIQNNETPLFIAVRNQSTDCIKLLLIYSNVCITAKNSTGETSLHVACRWPNNLEVLEMLAEHDETLAENYVYSMVALCMIAKFGTPDMAEFLILKGALEKNHHKKYAPIISAITESNLEMLIFFMFLEVLKPINKSKKLLLTWVHARGTLNRKIACFKIIFNYTYPDHCYRPTYPLRKVLKLIEICCMSEQAILPFFLETVYGTPENWQNYQLILKIREKLGTGFDLILIQLHKDFEKKYLDHKTNFPYAEIFACVVFQTNDPESYQLFMDYWKSTHHLHNEEYVKSLVQGIINGICDKGTNFSQFDKWRYKKVVQFLNSIKFYSTINIILTIFGLIPLELIEELLFIAAPYSDIEKEYDHWYHLEILYIHCPQIVRIHEINDYSIKRSQLDDTDLKKMCRDVIRREIYKKHNGDFYKFQQEILSLEVPDHLIDYLQFIECY